MILKTTEKGQALILIAFAAIGLFALAALAIDGSRVYSDKRHAQNAADTASLAGALAYARASDADKATTTTINAIIDDAARKRATSNGYTSGTNEVTITAEDVLPDGECGETDGKDITVNIVSYVNTTFARVIGRTQVTNAVTATARACGYYETPPLSNSPIISLNDTKDEPCGIDSGNADWKIKGGGVLSNGCASFHKKLDLVDDDSCVTTVGTVTDYPVPNTESCYNENQGSQKIEYPADVLKIMPPNPCGGIGIDDDTITPVGDTYTFSDGVYCVNEMDDYDRKEVVLNNATLYVTDTSFNLQFEGHGGFSGTGTQKGTYTGSDAYHGYFLIIAMYNDGDDSPCIDTQHGDQVLEIRGNSGQSITGSILAPSACVDFSGNSEAGAMNSQVIGYTISTNGSAIIDVQYNPANNPKVPVLPSLTQLK